MLILIYRRGVTHEVRSRCCSKSSTPASRTIRSRRCNQASNTLRMVAHDPLARLPTAANPTSTSTKTTLKPEAPVFFVYVPGHPKETSPAATSHFQLKLPSKMRRKNFPLPYSIDYNAHGNILNERSHQENFKCLSSDVNSALANTTQKHARFTPKPRTEQASKPMSNKEIASLLKKRDRETPKDAVE